MLPATIQRGRFDGPNGGSLSLSRGINSDRFSTPVDITGTNFTVNMSNSGNNAANEMGDLTVAATDVLNLDFVTLIAIPRNLTINGTVNFAPGSRSNQIASTSSVTDNGILNPTASATRSPRDRHGRSCSAPARHPQQRGRYLDGSLSNGGRRHAEQDRQGR